VEIEASDIPVIYETDNERIFIADDEKAIAHPTQMVLEKLGYHIIPLTSNLEALTISLPRF
jgi:predicted ATPase